MTQKGLPGRYAVGAGIGHGAATQVSDHGEDTVIIGGGRRASLVKMAPTCVSTVLSESPSVARSGSTYLRNWILAVIGMGMPGVFRNRIRDLIRGCSSTVRNERAPAPAGPR